MNVFKLHVIPPPQPLNWSSPRTLLADTLKVHVLQKAYPIGHFYIEIQSEKPNRFGVHHVVTGMSRTNKNLTTLQVILANVGLGTLFYDFPGQVDQGVTAKAELTKLSKKNRLKTLTIPLTDEKVELMWDELNEWIKNGSFKHYGSLDIARGEGSGCAEFGVHFMNLALGVNATPREWIRSVYAPKNLVGGAKTGTSVSMLKVYRDGHSWAKNDQEGFLYETPDMELTWQWLEKKNPGQKEAILAPGQINWKTNPLKRISFEKNYPIENDSTIQAQWKKISL